MKNHLFSAFILFFFINIGAVAQDTIYYQVAFPHLAHHEAEISVTYRNIPSGKPLEVRMSLSSPGRYALHQFGKNVYNVHATDKAGQPVTVTRVKPETWEISGHNGYAEVSYTVFANYPDGTYAGIDPLFAHFNMPAVFMWAKGMDTLPIKVDFQLPEDQWKVATQLKKSGSQYIARDFQYFMDSPTIMGDLTSTSFKAGQKNNEQDVMVALNPSVGEGVAEGYTQMIQKVVQEEERVFSKLPEYDDGTYTFLLSYGPQFHGDGMEHRNSTMITSGMDLEGNEKTLIRTVAHEFFHCWNVERIRPKSLEPFDFENTNMSGELWFAEGFTSYYTELVLARAGIYNAEEFGDRLGKLLNYVLNSGGTGQSSPVEMSKQAAFVDAATAVDQTNFVNTFTSYYPYGAVIGLALDLELRNKFDLTLDQLMRGMWQKFGKKEVSYTNDDILALLGELTKDKKFAKQFFDNYVYGTQVPDYAALLEEMGYQLKRVYPNTASLGNVKIGYKNDTLQLLSPPSRHTPLYKAGLDIGDQVLNINGVKVGNDEELKALLRQHQPGDKVEIEYLHFGISNTAELTFSETQDYEVVLMEKPSKDLLSRRSEWLKPGVQ